MHLSINVESISLSIVSLNRIICPIIISINQCWMRIIAFTHIPKRTLTKVYFLLISITIIGINQTTVAHTFLSKENKWSKWQRGQTLDPNHEKEIKYFRYHFFLWLLPIQLNKSRITFGSESRTNKKMEDIFLQEMTKNNIFLVKKYS